MPKMVEVSVNVLNLKEFTALYAAVGTLLNEQKALGPFTPVGHLEMAFSHLEDAYDRIPIEVTDA